MTSTGFTRYQQLPYPTSQRVRGNGASDVEALAVKADASLDAIAAAWSTVLRPDSSVYVLSSNITGIPANSNFTGINLSSSALWGANPPTGNGPGQLAASEAWGWYSVSAAISCIPSGTKTANSRRTMTVSILDASGSGTPVQSYIREDYETNLGEEVVLQVDFVSFFGQNWRIVMNFFHANTGSTMNITTTNTNLAFNRIMGTG